MATLRDIRDRIKSMSQDRKTRLEKAAPPEIRARVREQLA